MLLCRYKRIKKKGTKEKMEIYEILKKIDLQEFDNLENEKNDLLYYSNIKIIEELGEIKNEKI